MQSTTLIITIVLMILVALLFFWAVRSVNADREMSDVEKKRGRLIWGMLILGGLVTLGSLRVWPHMIPVGEDVVQFNATGGSWYWEIDTYEVPLGKTVVFNLTTVDVNHGFGVVDEEGTLLFQTQAMPGYVNKVKYVFDTPGTYRVVCMEFCGIGHHAMTNEFEVLAEMQE